uniref:Intraflagellar transport protein 22 homolog n=1 Tax=Equus asinus TaxID=9793 RepID=A0A8C4PRA0_EQUAS
MLKAKILFVGPSEPCVLILWVYEGPDNLHFAGAIRPEEHMERNAFNLESGKTVLANFLTESSDITEYNPTQGVRILEFENPHVTSNNKGAGCEFELWDCGGDPKFESCWPALMKDAHGVVVVFNADMPSHLKELEMWYSCFVQQQLLQDTQCLLIAHHKPGSGSDRGSLSLPPPLNRLRLVHSNLEDDPEEIRLEFIKYLKSVVSSVSESRDREEMSIMT